MRGMIWLETAIKSKITGRDVSRIKDWQETDPNVKIAENKDKKDILKEKIDFKNEIDL
ncbi:hypothetical protein F2Q69_00037224 [Brassica cretica]|uniref:Uncharacterized protein n=1 Tax=Brassica cretica TaxID=69181 RepID=A0A8S9STY0_BRACR|nr:hypothetical protein F2Q69_00037224 [Brassica cretica]